MTSVSINDAHNKGNVRVHTISGEKIKFQNILLQDSTFYGVTKNNIVKLDTSVFSAIFLEHKRPTEYTKPSNSFMYIGPGGVLGAIFLITQH
jgi:hypothetical protein